jgi:hypothetical protein
MLRQALLALACSGCISSAHSLFRVSEFSVSACGYQSDFEDLPFFSACLISGACQPRPDFWFWRGELFAGITGGDQFNTVILILMGNP